MPARRGSDADHHAVWLRSLTGQRPVETGVTERVDAALLVNEPVAESIGSGRDGTDRSDRRNAKATGSGWKRAVEPGIAEAVDPPVCLGEPIAFAVGCARDPRESRSELCCGCSRSPERERLISDPGDVAQVGLTKCHVPGTTSAPSRPRVADPPTNGGMTNVADHVPSGATGTTMNSSGPVVVPCSKVSVGNELALQPGPAFPLRATTVPTGPDLEPSDMVAVCTAVAGSGAIATRKAPSVTDVPISAWRDAAEFLAVLGNSCAFLLSLDWGLLTRDKPARA